MPRTPLDGTDVKELSPDDPFIYRPAPEELDPPGASLDEDPFIYRPRYTEDPRNIAPPPGVNVVSQADSPAPDLARQQALRVDPDPGISQAREGLLDTSPQPGFEQTQRLAPARQARVDAVEVQIERQKLGKEHADFVADEPKPGGIFERWGERNKAKFEAENPGEVAPVTLPEKLANIKDPMDLVPFSLSKSARMFRIFSAAKRLEKNEYIIHGVWDKKGYDRRADIESVESYIDELDEMSKRPETFWAQWGTVLTEAPAFLIEFAVSGGAAVGLKRATRAKAAAILGRYVESKAAKGVLHKAADKAADLAFVTTAQAAILAPSQGAHQALERLLPEGMVVHDTRLMSFDLEGNVVPLIGPDDGIAQAWAKSFADVWIEVLSEKSGFLLSKLGRGIPGAKSVRDTMKAHMRSTRSGARFLDALDKGNPYAQMAAFHGTIAEMGEERVGAMLRAMAGVAPAGWRELDPSDPSPTAPWVSRETRAELFDQIIPTWRELLVEATTFPVITGAQAGLGYALGGRRGGRRGAAPTPTAYTVPTPGGRVDIDKLVTGVPGGQQAPPGEFSYVAVNARGREFRGFIDAENTAEAEEKLRADGLFPPTLTPATEISPPPTEADPGREIGGRLAEAEAADPAFGQELGSAVVSALESRGVDLGATGAKAAQLDTDYSNDPDVLRAAVADMLPGDAPAGAEIVTLVETEEDYPPAVKDYVRGQGIPLTQVPAAFDSKSGKVYVAMNQANTVRKVQDTVIHEVAIHKGLLAAMGEEKLGKLSNDVWGSLSEEERAEVAERWGLDPSQTERIGEEWLAKEAERVARDGYKTNTVWSKIVVGVRRALRALGATTEFSDREIAALVAKGIGAVAAGRRAEGGATKLSVTLLEQKAAAKVGPPNPHLFKGLGIEDRLKVEAAQSKILAVAEESPEAMPM